MLVYLTYEKSNKKATDIKSLFFHNCKGLTRKKNKKINKKIKKLTKYFRWGNEKKKIFSDKILWCPNRFSQVMRDGPSLMHKLVLEEKRIR